MQADDDKRQLIHEIQTLLVEIDQLSAQLAQGRSARNAYLFRAPLEIQMKDEKIKKEHIHAYSIRCQGA